MSQVIELEPDTTIPLQVYRCRDRHWHFIPHRQDESRHPPWYIMHLKRNDEQKFRNWSKVYVQGRGSEKFQIHYKYKCDFYNLEDSEGKSWCSGRYGQQSPMMYREEELSNAPWVTGKPPAYESSSSGDPGDSGNSKN